jgi:hypothetical protein
MFRLQFTAIAASQLAELERDTGRFRQFRAVRKALARLEQNPNYPALNVHPFRGELCPHGRALFEAYAQNRTPGAFRIFFCYDPDVTKGIVVIAITPHP